VAGGGLLVARIDLTDFSGGINESFSPGDFTERQHTVMKGFVIEDEARIRSQGAIQRVSSDSDVKAVMAVQLESNPFLVGLRTNGQLVWMAMPSRTATNTQTTAATWSTFSENPPNNTNYQFITTFRHKKGNEYTNALLVASVFASGGTNNGVVIWEDDTSSPVVLRADLYPNRFPRRSNVLSGITMNNNGGGSGYTSAPTVTITGGGPVVATATANRSGGVITSFTVSNGGARYATAPIVTITGGGGSGGQGRAVIDSNGVVTSISVVSGGSGYTSAPTVTLVGGNGQARATAAVSNGAVSSVTVTDGGFGYSSAPTIGFSGGGGSGAAASARRELRSDAGIVPYCNIGCTLRGQLVLGGIRWSPTTESFTTGNTKRNPYSHFLWIAETVSGGDNTRFDPRFPYEAADAGAVITALQEVYDGLLVITTPTSSGRSGIVLHRGEVLSGEAVVEPLRPGLGMAPKISAIHQRRHTWWNEVASTVFVDHLGKVQQVRGNEIIRIDRYGPVAPETSNGSELCESIGSWLFVYRAGRLLLLRSFGQDGAWTELVLPPGNLRSMSAYRDELYFTMVETGGVSKVFRYCIEGPNAERGLIENQPVDLTFGSRTLGNPQETLEKWWEGMTIRAEGLANAELRTVKLLSGTPLIVPEVAGASFVLNQQLSSRAEVSVPGLGPSIECSALVTFRGDVRIENLSFDVVAGGERL
jgi:hypothetical protein